MARSRPDNGGGSPAPSLGFQFPQSEGAGRHGDAVRRFTDIYPVPRPSEWNRTAIHLVFVVSLVNVIVVLNYFILQTLVVY